MKDGFTKAVGSTRLWRVQFGVPPNCGGVRSTVFGRMNSGCVRMPFVAGVTPETTRVTRVLPHFSVMTF